MKKPFILTLAILMCFVICACNKNGDEIGTETIIVEVTDTDGNVVTDDEGNAVTEIIIVDDTDETTTEATDTTGTTAADAGWTKNY